jgi:hypothetical protein
MRKLVFAALRDNDKLAIDVLAAALLREARELGKHPTDEAKARRYTPLSGDEFRNLVREQYKAMFSLDDAALARAIERGNKELAKPEYSDAREFANGGRH